MDYICDKCGHSFKYPSLLKKHKNRKTSCIYVCDICTKSFSSKTKMLTHRKNCRVDNHYNDDETHQCVYCQRNYATKYTLKTHMETCSKLNAIAIEEVQKLRQEVKLLREQQTTTHNTYIQQTFNGPINNTVNTTNITVVFGKEDMDRLEPDTLKAIFGSGKSIRVEYLRNVHANPELPEYRNIKYKPDVGQFEIRGSTSNGMNDWLPESERVVHSMINQNVKRLTMVKNNEMVGQSEDIDKTLYYINSRPVMPKIEEEESEAYKEVLSANSEL